MTTTHTIAIVEDDAPLRDAIDNLLRSSGFKTYLYPSAIDFLAACETKADLIITDVKMPGMTGLELQEILRDRGSILPVIVITALLDTAVVRKASDLGAIACLLKPVDESTLMNAIKDALASHR